MAHFGSTPRAVWPPEPGFYKMRLCKGGWPVPCEIRILKHGAWQTVIDGRESPTAFDPIAVQADRIWYAGEPIPEYQYRYLLALREQAPDDHPARNPLKPINPSRLSPLPYRSAS
jgi:hypothetical protein